MFSARASILAAGLLLPLISAFPVVVAEAEPAGTPTEAYRLGLAHLAAGDSGKAVAALEFAAERGVLGAQLKLGSLYARGEQTLRDDAKAFRYYSEAADSYAEISPVHPVAPYVARAFVALGNLHETGVPSLGIKPDLKRAADLRQHAASYFGDAEAQYELARMYLSGLGTSKNVGIGINWLTKAVRKQHVGAQAVLGEILWQGELVRRRPGRGLALLMLARERSRGDDIKDGWIGGLAKNAWDQADAAVRQEAEALTLVWGVPEAIQIDAQEIAVLEPDAEVDLHVLGMARSAFAEPVSLTSAPPSLDSEQLRPQDRDGATSEQKAGMIAPSNPVQ